MPSTSIKEDLALNKHIHKCNVLSLYLQLCSEGEEARKRSKYGSTNAACLCVSQDPRTKLAKVTLCCRAQRGSRQGCSGGFQRARARQS